MTQETGDRRGLAAMSASVLLGSVVPLWIALSEGSGSPFYFILWWCIGDALGALGFLSLASRRLGVVPGFAALWGVALFTLGRLWSWPFLAAVGNSMVFGCFALAVRYVDPGLVAVFLEAWPLLFVGLMLFRYRSSERWRFRPAWILPLLGLSLAGFALVALSQGGTAVFTGMAGSAWTDLALGLAWAVLGAGLGGVGMYGTFRWGLAWARDWRAVGLAAAAGDSGVGAAPSKSLEFFGTSLAFGLGYLFGIPVALALAWLAGGLGWAGASWSQTTALGPGWLPEFGVGSALVMAFVGGLLLNAGPSLLGRLGNLLTSNLGVNALVYGGPLLGLVWLGVFSELSVARVDWLAAGALLVTAGNVLVNWPARRRAGAVGRVDESADAVAATDA